MSRKANPAIIGAFVVGGLVLLVAGILVLTSGRYFHDTERVVVYFRQSVYGLRVGAPVTFKGIEVGEVRDLRINLRRVRQGRDQVRIPVILELDPDRLSAEGVTFDFEDPRTVATLVEEGLRAELALESFLTGLRYVALDMKPGTPAELVAEPSTELPEIPSLPARTEELQQKLSEVVDSLARADIVGLFDSARALTESAHAVVSAPELMHAVQRLDRLVADLDAAALALSRAARGLGPKGAIGAQITLASKNAELLAVESSETVVAMRRLLRPDSALLIDVEATLTELQDAARSFRRVSDQLSRDPGSLLRGGRQ